MRSMRSLSPHTHCSKGSHLTDVEGFWTRRKGDVVLTTLSDGIVPIISEKETNTMMGSIISLVSTCVGTGLLALPFCFHAAGFELGACLLLLFCVSSGFGSYLLCQSCEWLGCFAYEDLMVFAFGESGAVGMGVVVIWLLVGAMTSIVVVAADVMTHIIEAAVEAIATADSWLNVKDHYPEAWECRHTIVLLMNIVIVILPLSLQARSTAGLKHCNTIAMLCTLLVLAILVAQGLFGFGAGETSTSANLARPTSMAEVYDDDKSRASVIQMLRVLPIIMLSVACQVQVPCVYGDLEKRSLPRMRQTLAGVGAICLCSYSLVGILGVVAAVRLHGANFAVTANILDSFPPRAPSALLMRGAMAVAATNVYPMLILPCRSALDHLVRLSRGASLEESSSAYMVRLEILLIVSATAFFAYCGGNLAAVFGFTGATAGALVSYLIPAVVFLRLRGMLEDDEDKRETRGWAVVSWCMLAFFGPLSLVEVCLQIFG